ncbi:MAG: ABC transporter ATP-binding protein [Inquilinus limosus]|uniref:ABC transporter ATP-binding protein n=1 Tax=Inquilinus limosus TaxID=171674 RepID=A0A952KIW9_9PROT|nr:ABC transporter ATP-binding protein [Inquilinus limosus]
MGVILAAERLGFTYPGRPRPVFDGVGLDVSAGEILCVLGPNGIGKSTLLRCLAGLAPPTTGIVRVAGRPIATLGRAEIARHLALVPQSHQSVFAFPVRTVVEMGRAPHLGWFGVPGREDVARASEALATLGIAHLADAPYTEISGGEQQLVQIARVLAQGPALMILDEPTAHLDFANQARFLALMRRLARQGLGILFTTHAPDHAHALADRTLILSPSEPPQLGPTAALLTEETLSGAYGVPIRLVRADGHVACVAVVD